MCHRKFLLKIAQNRDYIQIFAMIEEIHLILHVPNGIHIVKYNYMYSNTYINIINLIFV